MFRKLIYPSSGACDCVDELAHLSSCSLFVVCCSFCCGWYMVVFILQAEAHLFCDWYFYQRWKVFTARYGLEI